MFDISAAWGVPATVALALTLAAFAGTVIALVLLRRFRIDSRVIEAAERFESVDLTCREEICPERASNAQVRRRNRSRQTGHCRPAASLETHRRDLRYNHAVLRRRCNILHPLEPSGGGRGATCGETQAKPRCAHGDPRRLGMAGRLPAIVLAKPSDRFRDA